MKFKACLLEQWQSLYFFYMPVHYIKTTANDSIVWYEQSKCVAVEGLLYLAPLHSDGEAENLTRAATQGVLAAVCPFVDKEWLDCCPMRGFRQFVLLFADGPRETVYPGNLSVFVSVGKGIKVGERAFGVVNETGLALRRLQRWFRQVCLLRKWRDFSLAFLMGVSIPRLAPSSHVSELVSGLDVLIILQLKAMLLSGRK